jgi:single-strand DNA-binding protein
MNLNKVMIIGNLTRDPEMRTTPTGQSVTSFGVATSHSWTNANGEKEEKTEFHNIVAWGKLAEICAQYLSKGRKVYVEGRLQTRDWQGQDGVKRYRTEIIAENMIILDKSGNASTTIKNNESISASSEIQPDSPSNPDHNALKTEEVEVENIPF